MHIPVLQKEVLEYLNPKPNENFIDCTFGEGGHALAILEKVRPSGRVLGIDWSSELIEKFKERVILVCENFANLKKIVKECEFGRVKGILFDLGMSSWHLEKSGRGFTFLKDEPLDMRYDVTTFPRPSKSGYGVTAAEIVNNWPEKEIEKILREYGEERFAKKITKKIIETRKTKPIKTTFQLTEVIKRGFPRQYRYGKIHFATRTFQALRIAVNEELENLKKVLPQALEILEPGGRIVIISFHSLEDRIVKNFFREKSKVPRSPEATGMAAEGLAKNLLKILTKKPITPSDSEIKINPRSRSAKLRAAIKISNI